VSAFISISCLIADMSPDSTFRLILFGVTLTEDWGSTVPAGSTIDGCAEREAVSPSPGPDGSARVGEPSSSCATGKLSGESWSSHVLHSSMILFMTFL
jgi:hypothetical protein